MIFYILQFFNYIIKKFSTLALFGCSYLIIWSKTAFKT